MIKLSLFRSFALASSLLIAGTASAQTFNPPSAPSFSYPPSPIVARPNSIANYSVRNVQSAFGPVDLYLSGWSGGTNGFTWIMTNPGSPTSVLAQGNFPYSNVQDLGVGFVHGSGVDYIYVVGYRNGFGHFMDRYFINASSFGTPVGFTGTTMLSGSPRYGRIRIDSHKGYGNAVAWHFPGIGLQTIAANGGVWGNVVDVAGTVDCDDPDVAFSHSSGNLNVHYVCHDKPALSVIESVMDWGTLLTAPAGSSLPPTIEDINFVGTNESLRPVLDCPDHYDVENWAYAYTANNWEVSVRFVDYHTSGSPTTAIVNNGSLGNVPFLNSKSFFPCLSYNDGSFGESIQVGWYTTVGTWSGYIGLAANESLTALLSAPDYNRLPNAISSVFYPLRPGIAYSKASDIGGIAPNFMYASYYTLDGSTGSYDIHNAFHSWGNTNFKGAANPVYHPECGEQPTKNVLSTVNSQINTFPNPFTNELTSSFEMKEAGKVELKLVDLTGRVVNQISKEVEAGQQTLSITNTKSLPAGMYLLQMSVNGSRLEQQKVIKK